MLYVKHILFPIDFSDLFPIDFSDRCCVAAPFVEAVASGFKARITLLSVVEPLRPTRAVGDASIRLEAEELRSVAQARLDLALPDKFRELQVDRVALIGDPAASITRFARDSGVDLIMMPARGYLSFRDSQLGSVTSKVLRDAHCPVWTAADAETPLVHDHLPCRHILSAVDGTPKSVALMKWAADYALGIGATLRLVHVAPGDGNESGRRDEVYDVIRGLAKAAGVEAPLCATAGDMPRAMCEEAQWHGADLIVIGRSAPRGTGIQATRLIRQSPCPVISV